MQLKATETLLTAEQRAALDAHDRSVSLAAGAGCGKTFVLTERFLSYLDPRVLEPTAELTELVAITFTDAAAREMRERIRGRCYQRLEAASSSDEQQAWQKLIRGLDEARISTIHSFCATLLRRYAAEAEVDPRFELLNGPATELLRIQTLDNRLRQLLIASDQRLIQLATRFGLQNLRDFVAELLGENSQTRIEKWRTVTGAERVATWRKYHAETIVPAAIARLLEAEPVSELRQLSETAEVSKDSLQERFQEIRQHLTDLPGCDSIEIALSSLRELAKVQGICTKKDWSDEAEYNQYRDACAAVRKLVDGNILRPATEFVFAWGDAERAARLELIDSAIEAELVVGPARSVNILPLRLTLILEPMNCQETPTRQSNKTTVAFDASCKLASDVKQTTYGNRKLKTSLPRYAE